MAHRLGGTLAAWTAPSDLILADLHGGDISSQRLAWIEGKEGWWLHITWEFFFKEPNTATVATMVGMRKELSAPFPLAMAFRGRKRNLERQIEEKREKIESQIEWRKRAHIRG